MAKSPLREIASTINIEHSVNNRAYAVNFNQYALNLLLQVAYVHLVETYPFTYETLTLLLNKKPEILNKALLKPKRNEFEIVAEYAYLYRLLTTYYKNAPAESIKQLLKLKGEMYKELLEITELSIAEDFRLSASPYYPKWRDLERNNKIKESASLLNGLMKKSDINVFLARQNKLSVRQIRRIIASPTPTELELVVDLIMGFVKRKKRKINNDTKRQQIALEQELQDSANNEYHKNPNLSKNAIAQRLAKKPKFAHWKPDTISRKIKL